MEESLILFTESFKLFPEKSSSKHCSGVVETGFALVSFVWITEDVLDSFFEYEYIPKIKTQQMTAQMSVIHPMIEIITLLFIQLLLFIFLVPEKVYLILT